MNSRVDHVVVAPVRLAPEEVLGLDLRDPQENSAMKNCCQNTLDPVAAEESVSCIMQWRPHSFAVDPLGKMTVGVLLKRCLRFEDGSFKKGGNIWPEFVKKGRRNNEVHFLRDSPYWDVSVTGIGELDPEEPVDFMSGSHLKRSPGLSSSTHGSMNIVKRISHSVSDSAVSRQGMETKMKI